MTDRSVTNPNRGFRSSSTYRLGTGSSRLSFSRQTGSLKRGRWTCGFPVRPNPAGSGYEDPTSGLPAIRLWERLRVGGVGEVLTY